MGLKKVIDRFSGEHRFLSNFSEHAVYYKRRIWPTAEHAYQAMKATTKSEQEKIRLSLTPAEAKKKGRKLNLRSDWEYVKVQFMTEIVTAKFKQNPEIKDMLLETLDAHLVEGNDWGDTYWGQVNGKGENKLGQILMYVRFEIQQVMNPIRCPECGHTFSGD